MGLGFYGTLGDSLHGPGLALSYTLFSVPYHITIKTNNNLFMTCTIHPLYTADGALGIRACEGPAGGVQPGHRLLRGYVLFVLFVLLSCILCLIH